MHHLVSGGPRVWIAEAREQRSGGWGWGRPLQRESNGSHATGVDDLHILGRDRVATARTASAIALDAMRAAGRSPAGHDNLVRVVFLIVV